MTVKVRRLKVGLLTIGLVAVTAACGPRSSDSGSGGTGSSGASTGIVAKAKGDRKLTIGIKFDQPGLGLKTPDGSYSGFDVSVAEYVANKLGVPEQGLTFVEAKSANRETMLENGQADMIVGTYSITAKRLAVVDFAGPYFIAHQDLLVRSDETDITGPASLNNGKKLCSVTGSTSAQTVKDKFANAVQLQEYSKYSDCLSALLSKSVDAITTDDVILAGYAAQPEYKGKVKVVGKGFSDEKYGVGLKKGDTAGVAAINAALTEMISDGSWKQFLTDNVGASGYAIGSPPTPGSS